LNPENLWINNIITICAIAFAFVVILFFMRLDSKEEGIKPSKVVSLITKYSLLLGVIFIVIGLIIWSPILNGSETMLGYKGQELQEDIIVILDTAYFNLQFFLRSLLGLSAVIIGIIFVVAGLFRGIEKLFKGVKRWKIKPN
jgi:hypothetical protein